MNQIFLEVKNLAINTWETVLDTINIMTLENYQVTTSKVKNLLNNFMGKVLEKV